MLPMQGVPTPVESDTPQQLSGWVGPDGRVYHCAFTQHNSLADRLVYHQCGERAYDRYDAAQLLDRKGWVHLWEDGSWVCLTGEPTQAQLDTLWDIAQVAPVSYFALRVLRDLDGLLALEGGIRAYAS